MGSKSKKNRKQGLINPTASLQRAPKIPVSVEEHRVQLSFRRADSGKSGCLSLCQKPQVKEVVNTLRVISELNWNGVHRHKGLKATQIPDESRTFPRPNYLSDDVGIWEVRFSQKGRIFWYREEQTMTLLWFDPGHDGTGR